MTTAGKGDYGLGVGVYERRGLKVIDHPGRIEGFSTHMTYVPDRKIAVIVLSNVYGQTVEIMAGQLLDVVLGNTVVLSAERKTALISLRELSKFVGTYEDASLGSMEFAIAEDALSVKLSRLGFRTNLPPMPLLYVGTGDGHPRFYLSEFDVEFEFLPDTDGSVSALIQHRSGHDSQRAQKRVH